MNSTRAMVLIAVVIAIAIAVAVVPVVPAAAQMTRDEAMKLAEQYRGQLGGVQATAPEPIELREADVLGFVTAVTQLRELGVALELAGERTDTQRMARALVANERAYSILKSNGFDPARFQQVTYSIALALAKLDGEFDESTLDEARTAQAEAMEKLKGRLTPEQLEAMQRGMGAASSYIDALSNQPPGNATLVRTHRDALKKAIGDGG